MKRFMLIATLLFMIMGSVYSIGADRPGIRNGTVTGWIAVIRGASDAADTMLYVNGTWAYIKGDKILTASTADDSGFVRLTALIDSLVPFHGWARDDSSNYNTAYVHAITPHDSTLLAENGVSITNIVFETTTLADPGTDTLVPTEAAVRTAIATNLTDAKAAIAESLATVIIRPNVETVTIVPDTLEVSVIKIGNFYHYMDASSGAEIIEEIP